MNIQIEALSAECLSNYFKKAGAFQNPVVFEERVEKLSLYASFVTARNEEWQIVGALGFYMNTKPICYITHVSVIESYKRNGIATKMLSFLEAEAFKRGFLFMKLEVHKDNHSAIIVYKKVGFSIKCDSSNGSYYMEKKL